MPARSNAWARAVHELATPALAGLALFYGLVVATHAVFRPRGAACLADSECPAATFCDRDACAPLPASYFTPRSFGTECSSDRECGGYLCIADRCRSCAADDECSAQASGQAVCMTGALTAGSRCAPRPRAQLTSGVSRR